METNINKLQSLVGKGEQQRIMNKHQATLPAAYALYELAKLNLDTIKQQLKDSEQKVIDSNVFYYDFDGIPKDKRITEQSAAYLMGDSDYKKYRELCLTQYKKDSIQLHEPNNANYSQEYNFLKSFLDARKLLVRSIIDVMIDMRILNRETDKSAIEYIKLSVVQSDKLIARFESVFFKKQRGLNK